MEYILTELDDKILIISINRPEALNALKPELILQIGEALKKQANNQELNGVIITGTGEKAFAAGADIKGFPNLTESAGIAVSKEGHDVFNYIENYPKPVIAAVNGFALGGGCELAMACHMRVASENALFGMPEVKLGLIPGYGGTQRLVQLIGKSKALEYILTGDMINAPTALTLGLVNHVVTPDQCLIKAKELIAKIARNGPKAVATAIKTINSYFDKKINGFDFEMQNFGSLMVSDEGKEGINAFLEKRKANFR